MIFFGGGWLWVGRWEGMSLNIHLPSISDMFLLFLHSLTTSVDPWNLKLKKSKIDHASKKLESLVEIKRKLNSWWTTNLLKFVSKIEKRKKKVPSMPYCYYTSYTTYSEITSGMLMLSFSGFCANAYRRSTVLKWGVNWFVYDEVNELPLVKIIPTPDLIPEFHLHFKRE